MNEFSLLPALVPATIQAATPLLFAALGGLISERAGIVNLALEGMMLAGAFAGACAAILLHDAVPGHPAAAAAGAVMAALVAGALVALLHAAACITFRADQVVSGIALNMLVLGLTVFFSQSIFHMKGGTPQLEEVTLGRLSLGASMALSPLCFVAAAVLPVAGFLLFSTPFGLRLRACGEHPRAAATVGIPVARIRYLAVLASGLLAGLGGLYLVFDVGSFSKEMTSGRGYIALAAIIFGRWRPGLTLAGCLLFGLAQSLQLQLQGRVEVPVAFLQMLPYGVTLVVLAGAIGRSTPPAALGKTG
ncbi:MAG: ABC transporter permease [Planctomycetes bacterium]|nr:ABC transporter permease [Planctomycetota bacterium]